MGILYFCIQPYVSGIKLQTLDNLYVQPNDFVNSLCWFLQAINCNLV